MLRKVGVWLLASLALSAVFVWHSRSVQLCLCCVCTTNHSMCFTCTLQSVLVEGDRVEEQELSEV